MGNKKENSADPKSETRTSLESLENKELSEEMRQTLEDYMLSLHGISDDSKDAYIRLVRIFALSITQRSIRRFEDATAKDIDIFLSRYHKDSTKLRQDDSQSLPQNQSLRLLSSESKRELSEDLLIELVLLRFRKRPQVASSMPR